MSNFSLSNASNRKEDEWVRALLRREEAAYRDLIVSFSSRLYKGIFQILRNEEESQEVLQDVFVKVLEKIQDFKGESQLGTWLYRIAVNEALMRLRSRKKVSSISWDEVGPRFEDQIIRDDVPEWTELSDQMLIRKEALAYIQTCVEELPEEYRVAYILKDMEQLSEDEVVGILGISKAVMKIRVHRARLFLRKKIEEKYVDRK